MIKKLHKIPDRVFFNTIFLILILWNLSFIDMPIRVAYAMVLGRYIETNSYYAPLKKLRQEIKAYPDFYDEGEVGFVSDIENANIFGSESSIKAFFISQYAIVPSIMKAESKQKYLIGSFSNPKKIPNNLSVLKKINKNLYLLERKGKIND